MTTLRLPGPRFAFAEFKPPPVGTENPQQSYVNEEYFALNDKRGECTHNLSGILQKDPRALMAVVEAGSTSVARAHMVVGKSSWNPQSVACH